MSQENVELVRRLQPSPDTDLVALFRDDPTALRALSPFFHEDCELVAPRVIGGGQRLAGIEGLRAMWLDWLDPWESYRAEIEDVIDAGDDVVVLFRDHGRHPEMDVEVSVSGATTWTVRNGKVARVVFFVDRSEALAAAGLSD